MLPTGPALVEYWYGQLGLAERKIVRVLVDAGGQTMTKQQVADTAGYEATGGGSACVELAADVGTDRGEDRTAGECDADLRLTVVRL